MKRAILAATVSAFADRRDLDDIPSPATWLEVDASNGTSRTADWFRARFSGLLSFSLSRNGRPSNSCDPADRHARLQEAAAGFDIVDLNAATDLTPETLRAIPPERRMITWRGRAESPARILRLFEDLSDVGARYYRFVVQAETFAETCVPLVALKRLGRQDVLAFASGEIGFWTRLVAPRLGAPLVFGSASTQIRDDGQPSVQELIDDYGLPGLLSCNRICGILGNPVAQSQSPRLHNEGYRAAGHPALFVPFLARSLSEFWSTAVEQRAFAEMGLTLDGLTVASPFKEQASELAVSRCPIVTRARSCNLLVLSCQGPRAETTDPETIQSPLVERGLSPGQQRVAVIGCGGSGRAIAAALDLAGADVTLVNRSVNEGRRTAARLGLPFIPLSEFVPRGYSMIVNATPVGRHGEALPFHIGRLDRRAIVIDLVYSQLPTPLVCQARAAGCVVVDGFEVLAAQFRRQFESMTAVHMETSGAYQ